MLLNSISALLLSLICLQAEALVKSSIDAETQLKSWKLTQGALSLELLQRLPDQTRAFFQGRGFSSKIANDIATQCVLQTIMKNTSSKTAQTISYDLHDWKVFTNSTTRGLKLKQQWDQEWTEEQVSPAARIAFRWATFPTQQNFEPGGDYNWGMISVGLAPGSVFDLQVTWKQGDNLHTRLIKQIECPQDRP